MWKLFGEENWGETCIRLDKRLSLTHVKPCKFEGSKIELNVHFRWFFLKFPCMKLWQHNFRSLSSCIYASLSIFKMFLCRIYAPLYYCQMYQSMLLKPNVYQRNCIKQQKLCRCIMTALRQVFKTNKKTTESSHKEENDPRRCWHMDRVKNI